MIKKSLASVAAALGLLTIPTVTVAPQVPAPVEARQQAPSPVSKTDGRHSRLYVPKGVRKKDRRSRTTLLAEAFLGKPGIRNSNRFARRSVVKAAMRGAGRVHPEFTTAHDQYRIGARPTTARAIEQVLRVRSVLTARKARAIAARGLASGSGDES